MKLRAYSSIAAFMTHYAALRRALCDGARLSSERSPSSDDAATLIEMERIIDELSLADREALHDEAAAVFVDIPSGAAARHRARAELKLRRLLAARGLLTG
jgi:hypothetical protein